MIEFKLNIKSEKYEFEYWQRVDEHRSAVRFCTNWATKEENVDGLLTELRQLLMENK